MTDRHLGFSFDSDPSPSACESLIVRHKGVVWSAYMHAGHNAR